MPECDENTSQKQEVLQTKRQTFPHILRNLFVIKEENSLIRFDPKQRLFSVFKDRIFSAIF